MKNKEKNHLSLVQHPIRTNKCYMTSHITAHPLQKNTFFPMKFPTKNLKKFVRKRISNEFSNEKKFVGNSSSEIYPTKNFNFRWKFAMKFFWLENSLEKSWLNSLEKLQKKFFFSSKNRGKLN